MNPKMKELTRDQIKRRIDEYNDLPDVRGRETSFDYCFNYFQLFQKNPTGLYNSRENLETSCLQLGFYLASWGMMRNSPLQGLSFRGLEPVIRAIGDAGEQIWGIDLDKYSPETIPVVKCVGEQIRKSFVFKSKTKAGNIQVATDTLITKTMLGVFGCVPALDDFFKSGSGVGKFSEDSLKQFGDFYEVHKEIIGDCKRMTLDSKSGEKTKTQYSNAKIVDMLFFDKGFKKPYAEQSKDGS